MEFNENQLAHQNPTSKRRHIEIHVNSNSEPPHKKQATSSNVQAPILDEEYGHPKNHKIETKTGKAVEAVLGKGEETVKLDKLKTALNANPTSRYYKENYERQLAKVQIEVLKVLRQCNETVKEWDKTFYFENNEVPTLKDYESENRIYNSIKTRKIALKLLQYWNITVHM